MENIKQEILKVINSRNNIWTALIISTGGTLALMFNLDGKLKMMFFMIGMLFSIGFLYSYLLKGRYLDYLIEKTGELENVGK